MTPPSTAAPVRPELVTREVAIERAGWIERTLSADHKVIGQLYLGTALTFLALAAVEFALMRLQLIVPESSLIEPEIFNRLLTASTSSFVVLFAIPLVLGLAAYIVPLQIGARSTALPRLGQFSYWLYVFGAVTIYASFLYTVPETGTASLPPLSTDVAFSPSNGADAWFAGTALCVLGFTCLAIDLLATVGRVRAPGLALRRMPLFSWASTVGSAVMLLVGPAMLAALTMAIIDRRFDGIFFDAGHGGAPLLYEHLATLFFTGAYLIVFLGAAGVISEILPVFARKPIFSHGTIAGAFVAIGGLGVFAWMQSMYEAPINSGWTIAAMLVALALAVPIGLVFCTWIATLWDGALRLRAPAWYAIVSFSTMAIGLAGELGYSVIPVGWALDNTTASQGDTLYVLVGGAVIGGFAGLHYWFPKLSGRVLGEGLGKLALLLITVGIHLYVIPMFFAGLEGQPVDVFKYYEDIGLDGLNLVASFGAFVLVAGVLLELVNIAYSWGNGIDARGHDPWGGATLEWFALSPPPPHNFDAVPDVRSPEPLYDIRDAIARRGAAFTPPAPIVAAPQADASAEDDGATEEGAGSTAAADAPDETGGAGEPAAADAADESPSAAPVATPEQPATAESGGSGDEAPGVDEGSSRVEEGEVEAQPETPAEEEPQTTEADPETASEARDEAERGGDGPGSAPVA